MRHARDVWRLSRLLGVIAGMTVIAVSTAAATGVLQVRAPQRPSAAVAGGALLAAAALISYLILLVRRLRRADEQQRRLVVALRERQEFADTLLQSLNEGVVVLDAEHRVLDVNSRWQELTGRRPEEAVGRRPPYPWQFPADGGDQVLRRPDGSAVSVLTTTATIPDRDGRPRAYVETYVDITERKRHQDALAAHAAQMQQANDQLRAANAQLESALAFKSDLMSMLSHDVSQPISSIASLAELLTADWTDLPDDIRQELAGKIDKNTRRLVGMMNDLTLLFRLDAGKVTARRTPVPVREVVESVVTGLSANTVDDVTVSVDAELSALIDRAHLRHILQNLLSNAVRYGTAPIEVQAWREPDRIIIAVRDHGKGIPADLVPTLFDRFVRGAGLGLFIVRHLVEANGGTVRYEAGVPRGASLLVTLEPASMTGSTTEEP